MANRFPIKSSETLLGFSSRYARERNMDLPKFMRLTGIKIWHHASFDAAVARLATMTGNRAEELAFHALRMEDGRRHKLHGELIDRRDAYRDAARYCPRCVVDDYSAGDRRPFTKVFCRAAWMHRRIVVCPVHHVGLVSISKNYAGYAMEDFTSSMMHNWDEVAAAAENGPSVEVSAFDRYFYDRLNGAPVKHEVLSRLPYHGALGLCDVMGAMITGTDRKARSKHSREEIRIMAKSGFDLLSGGYRGLRAFLEELDKRHHGADDKSVGSKLYGEFYGFLHDNAGTPGFETLVNFVRDHAFSVHPLGPENNFLGRGGTRKFHSVRSAFTSYGIHPATLRKLLAANGLLDNETTPTRDLKVSIPVEIMDAVIEGWRDSVPMLFARERLGSSPQVVRQLVEAGIISMASEKSDYALKNIFSRKEIESLLARLDEKASLVDTARMLPIRNCVPFMSFADQLLGILDGKIPFGISKPGGVPTTLDHLRVDLDTLKAVAGIGHPAGYVTAKFVTSRLVALTDTVDRLASAGVFETMQYRSGNGLTVTAYSEASVQTFKKDHVSFRKLARGIEHYAKTEDRVRGIEPVHDFGGVERFYRKADVYL